MAANPSLPCYLYIPSFVRASRDPIPIKYRSKVPLFVGLRNVLRKCVKLFRPFLLAVELGRIAQVNRLCTP